MSIRFSSVPSRPKESTHRRFGHEGGEDGGVEARVQLAAEDRCGHVEAAADLALCEAVDVLREVMCEFAALARGLGAALGQERVGGDDAQV